MSFNLFSLTRKSISLGLLTLALSVGQLVTLPLLSGQAAQAAQTANAEEANTIKNLQAAYNGETNAHIQYLAFAQKADQEGYKQVALLFRAAATAEAIHASNHGVVLRELGVKAIAKIENPKVGSTKANLEAAIKGESYERDTMYPEFLKQAKEANNVAAIKTLDYAMEAEAEHAKYYQAALSNL
ncbi:MAG: rubrerythrin family protein, partial [Microcystaceae cyanobacterium]